MSGSSWRDRVNAGVVSCLGLGYSPFASGTAGTAGAVVIVWALRWAVKSGQFDDLQGPAHSILMDDDEPGEGSGEGLGNGGKGGPTDSA